MVCMWSTVVVSCCFDISYTKSIKATAKKNKGKQVQFTLRPKLNNNTLTSYFDSNFTFGSVKRLDYKSALTRHSERLRLIKWLKEAITLLILVTVMTSPYRQTAVIHHSDAHSHNAMTTGIFFRVFFCFIAFETTVSLKSNVCMMIAKYFLRTGFFF